MLHVLHLEDHASLRGAVAFMLEREPDIPMVVQAGSVAEARCLLPIMPIDVALIDLNLPDGSGLDLLPFLREHHPAAAAVVLTGSARPESPALAVAAGAVGFLHKTVCIEDIVAAIRRAAAGEILFTPEDIMTYLCKAAQYQLRTRDACQALARLTPREQKVRGSSPCERTKKIDLIDTLPHRFLGEALLNSPSGIHVTRPLV